jgi:hypothetical protein
VDAEVWRVLVPLVLAAGSGITWWVARRDKNKDPLPKAAAELALAAQALGIVTESAEYVRQDTINLRFDRDQDRVRIARLEADREEDRLRLADADDRMTRLERLLSQAAAYIEALLRWAQIMPSVPDKPIPPLPNQLHELVDPELWVTNGRPGVKKSTPVRRPPKNDDQS